MAAFDPSTFVPGQPQAKQAVTDGSFTQPLIQSTADVSSAQGIKCCVYGNSGMGKTRLLASAPAPIVLSSERGLLSLRTYNIPYIDIRSFDDLTNAYRWSIGSNEARQFATIGLDSISEIAEICLIDKKAINRNGMKAYGETGEDVMKVFRDFRDMPGKHVVMTAKQEWDKDAQGVTINRPTMPGKQLSVQLPYFFDELWQLNRWKDQNSGADMFALRTQPDQFNAAKDRSGTLAEWENADPATGGGLSYLFNKITQG